MGDDKPGIRIASESSIEIDFYYRGVRCRERLKLPPTSRNINYAAKLKASIEVEIAKGVFDYRKHFPDSRKARRFSALPGDNVTVETYLKQWLTAEKPNTKPSTWDGYNKVVKGRLIPAIRSTPAHPAKAQTRFRLHHNTGGHHCKDRSQYSVTIALCAR